MEVRAKGAVALTKESVEASTRGHQAGGASGMNAGGDGHEAEAEAEVVGRAREMMERMRRWLFGLRRPNVASTGALAPPVAPVQPVFLLYYTAKGGGLKGYSKAGHRNPDSQRSLSAAPAPTWQVVT